MGLPRGCFKRQGMEAASVSGKCHRVTSAIFSWSKHQRACAVPPPHDPHHQLEQLAEKMFYGKNDREPSLIAMEHKKRENWGRMRNADSLHIDSDRMVCETAWALIRHFCAILHSFIYSFKQSVNRMLCILCEKGSVLYLKNGIKRILEATHSFLPASVTCSMQEGILSSKLLN